MYQILFPEGLPQPLLLGGVAGPFPEPHPKWNADPRQALGLASNLETVGETGMTKAVQNQPDGVDESAVEIEQDG
jgi:hypothetical protein